MSTPILIIDGRLAYLVTHLRTTGARQIATGLNELHRRKGKVSTALLHDENNLSLVPKVLLTSMCIGTGMGAAAIFLRE